MPSKEQNRKQNIKIDKIKTELKSKEEEIEFLKEEIKSYDKSRDAWMETADDQYIEIYQLKEHIKKIKKGTLLKFQEVEIEDLIKEHNRMMEDMKARYSGFKAGADIRFNEYKSEMVATNEKLMMNYKRLEDKNKNQFKLIEEKEKMIEDLTFDKRSRKGGTNRQYKDMKRTEDAIMMLVFPDGCEGGYTTHHKLLKRIKYLCDEERKHNKIERLVFNNVNKGDVKCIIDGLKELMSDYGDESEKK